MLTSSSPIILIEEATSPEELVKSRTEREQFDCNSAWLQTNIPVVYSQHRGKFICIAGGELFVGDTVEDAIGQAQAAHPDDEGWFTRYIPKEKALRIYAN